MIAPTEGGREQQLEEGDEHDEDVEMDILAIAYYPTGAEPRPYRGSISSVLYAPTEYLRRGAIASDHVFEVSRLEPLQAQLRNNLFPYISSYIPILHKLYLSVHLLIQTDQRHPACRHRMLCP